MVTDEHNAIIERMIEEGKSAIAIRAAVPDVSRTNIYLKIAKFKKHGTVGRVQTKTLGRPRVMSEGVDKFLQGLLAAKPDMELEEMRRHMQDRLQLTVSMSTISRAITRAGIASGRPNRARNSTRRKNKTPATTEAADEALVGETSLSAQTNDGVVVDHSSTTNLVVSADEVGWEHMQQQQQHPSPLSQQDEHEANQHHHHHHPHDLDDHHHHHHHQLQTHLPQQPQSHNLMQAPPHHHNQHNEMHALDPSLAQQTSPYPLSTAYHGSNSGMYAGGANVSAAITSVLAPPNMDVYRSPYAPL